MKVGVIVDNDFFHDIRVRREVELLRDNGFHVYVLCVCFQREKTEDIDDVVIDCIYLPRRIKDGLFFLLNSFPLYNVVWARHVSGFIKRHNLQLIHTHDLYMSRPVFQGIKRSNKNVPFILDLHENYPVAITSYNWTKGFFRKMLVRPFRWKIKEKKYLQYPDRIIVLSEQFKSVLLERYDFLMPKNIAVFPNVIDFRKFESFKVEYQAQQCDIVTFFYFGAVAERRGIFTTLKVFENVFKSNKNVRLLIVGPVDKADRNEFSKMIKDPKISDAVEYIPWIDVSELVRYLSEIDVCLSPLVKNAQHESGVANKIYQYMFGRKPIIVSNCEPQMQLIHNANCGLSYSSAEEYQKCMEILAKDKGLREEMGNNGFNTLYDLFDNDAFNHNLLDVYSGLLQKIEHQ